MKLKMTVHEIKGGYYFQFHRYGKFALDLAVTFDGDTPVVEVDKISADLMESDIELYSEWAKKTALMFEE